MAADLYDLLGVSRTATPDEIKRAYRRRARDLHPDANPDDAEAEARFKELSQAYEILRDPGRRRQYDQFGAMGGGQGGDPFGGGLGDIFDAFFGGGGGQGPFGGGGSAQTGPPRGADLEAILQLDLEQAVFGAEEELEVRTAIPCDTCEATGARPGTRPKACDECGGSGQVRRVRQSILGQMVTAGPCGTCGGLGEVIEARCTDCGGEGRRVEPKSYVVDIPPGVDTGSTLRLGGRGAVGTRGGAAGDLFVHIEVRDHPRFTRDGDDLRFRLGVSPAQAALGVEIDLETFDGPKRVDVPGGSQSGTVLRERGLGAPRLRGRGRGDLLVDVVVETPEGLTEGEDELYRRLAELKGEDVAPPSAGLVGKLRSKLK